MSELHDVVIVGGGGAGLTAALYASRANLKTLLIEKITPGGQIFLTDIVENYPGFPEGITGPEISERMLEQAKKYGTHVLYEEVTGLSEAPLKTFKIKTTANEYEGKSLILAAGAAFRKLGVPGEVELTGRGVSYCATCDGAFFKGKQILVVGGGDSALQEGIFLTRFATQVTVVHRRDKLRATPILQDRAKANPKIRFVWNTVATSILGEKKVEAVKLQDLITKKETLQKTDGIFIFVGHDPSTSFLNNFVTCDEHGYVVTDTNYVTSRPGVFAAGEVRSGGVRQLVSACREGCGAALAAQHYLENLSLHEQQLKFV
jgi:thioredoxin reductase (NADPH)